MAIYDATWGEAQCAVKDGMGEKGEGWEERVATSSAQPTTRGIVKKNMATIPERNNSIQNKIWIKLYIAQILDQPNSLNPHVKVWIQDNYQDKNLDNVVYSANIRSCARLRTKYGRKSRATAIYKIPKNSLGKLRNACNGNVCGRIWRGDGAREIGSRA